MATRGGLWTAGTGLGQVWWCLVLGISGAWPAAADGAMSDAPIILFNRLERDETVYAWFDLGDPAEPTPHDLVALPTEPAQRALGLYNGMLFLLDSTNTLSGIDVATGDRFTAKEALPKRYIREDSMIYLPPADGRAEMRAIDLRARCMQSFPLPAPDPAGGWHEAGHTDAELFRLFQREPEFDGDERSFPCRVQDLRRPDAAT